MYAVKACAGGQYK